MSTASRGKLDTDVSELGSTQPCSHNLDVADDRMVVVCPPSSVTLDELPFSPSVHGAGVAIPTVSTVSGIAYLAGVCILKAICAPVLV